MESTVRLKNNLYMFKKKSIAIIFTFQIFNAFATDEIVCNSESFVISLIVGSDGTVPNVVLSDRDRSFFPEPLLARKSPEEMWIVDIENQKIDVKTSVSGKDFVILMNHGKGIIKSNLKAEKISCDWNL